MLPSGDRLCFAIRPQAEVGWRRGGRCKAEHQVGTAALPDGDHAFGALERPSRLCAREGGSYLSGETPREVARWATLLEKEERTYGR